jgi:hypothetical protein
MQQQIQEHFQTTDFIATLGVGLFNFVSFFVVEASPLDNILSGFYFWTSDRWPFE